MKFFLKTLLGLSVITMIGMILTDPKFSLDPLLSIAKFGLGIYASIIAIFIAHSIGDSIAGGK